MSYLLSISIGPVQDFIKAARKTRDLWFGSMMLSEISRAAALALAEEDGATLIFPSRQAVMAQSSVANKSLVITENPSMVADHAHSAAKKQLDAYKTDALRRIPVENAIHKDIFDAQIEHYLEFYAAWWPLEGYDQTRQAVERLLAGRKSLRNFSPAVGRAGIPKSSLDGGRESVLNGLARGNMSLGIKQNELLDAVSLIKRIAEPKRFVSVARVAIDPLIRRFTRTDKNTLASVEYVGAEIIAP